MSSKAREKNVGWRRKGDGRLLTWKKWIILNANSGGSI